MKKLGLFLSGAILSAPLPAWAADTVHENLCAGAGGTFTAGNCNTPGKSLEGSGGFVEVLTTTLLLVAGSVAVIIIIIGGIRYITSTGDSTRVKQAKDTVLFAVIGLIVVILAYAIVNFVIGAFT